VARTVREDRPVVLEALEPRLMLSASGLALQGSPLLNTPDGAAIVAPATLNTAVAAATATAGDESGYSQGATLVNQATSAFDIVIVAGAGLQANAQALAAFERAAQQWEAIFSDPVTVYISANLASLSSTSVIGQTSSVTLVGGYELIRDLLVSDAADEADDGIVAALPTASQVSFTLPSGFSTSGNLAATKANLKAMGVTGLDEQFGSTDATITFNSRFSFDYDNSDSVTANTMDFETVAAHEIGHALGFTSAVDTVDYYASRGQSVTFAPEVLDLFRFADGTAADPSTVSQFTSFPRELRPAVVAVTDQISPWNSASAETLMSTGAYTGDGRQASHWKDNLALGLLDPTLSYGEVVAISDEDIRALDLIGWDIGEAVVQPSNVAPTAGDDVGSTTADAVLSVAAPGVLGNDSDSDGGTVSVSSYSSVSAMGAAVSVTANGGYTYDPRGSAALQALADGQTAEDTFTYTITDGQGGSDTATVRITVTGVQVGVVNQPPVAVDDSASVHKKRGTASGNVLSNDTDPDGDSLSAVLVSAPADGTLDFNTATGNFTYTAGSTFSGTDTFTYRAVDSNGALSNVATVVIGGSAGGTGGTGGGSNNGKGGPKITRDALNAAHLMLGAAPASSLFTIAPAWQPVTNLLNHSGNYTLSVVDSL
jgi:VCBS repeat-containing protein